MRISLITTCMALGISGIHAQELSPADREALLERLEALDKTADQTVDARYRLAVAAYREAMMSDEKAIELYLKCYEKVEYLDLKRKNQDFRDWKKKEDENLGKASYRRALRHQLRWLSLTLEAASSSSVRSTLNSKAKDNIMAIFEDLKLMGDQEGVLTQPVTATVFAKAYDIDTVTVENWPLSPLPLEDLY